MCGIAAQYGQQDLSLGVRMLSRITHRGPDDIGYVRTGEQAWLGHVRLSIIDLAGGRQPLSGEPSEGGELLSMVCNGEIYNHTELGEELGSEQFGSESDNESALWLVLEYGPKALAQLRGMWALAISGPDTFIAARDPLGIKPLYWARGTGADGQPVVLFASEIRAFDRAWLPSVEAFPPGHYWSPEDGLVCFATAVERFTESAGPVIDTDYDDIVARTRAVITESVRQHLQADVEVGVFLSGGLDSSLIAAVAQQIYARQGRRLKTFAVGTADSPDLLAAREVADYLGTEHYEATFDAERAHAAIGDVVRAVESFDASLIRSAIPNWFLSELAAEHVKVVLTGEGADELFGGYAYYHEAFTDSAALQTELLRTIETLHGLNLQRCDRVTMAHSLEARVPFLDKEVIGFAMAIPARHKLAPEATMEKQLLRRAFTGMLPEHILWRKKVQFGTGSGAEQVLTAAIGEKIPEQQWRGHAEDVQPPLRSAEEYAYFQIFSDSLPGVRPEAVLTRFATV